MLKVNNKNTKTKSWRRFGAFIVNFEHISHSFLMLLLLSLNKYMLAWFSPFIGAKRLSTSAKTSKRNIQSKPIKIFFISFYRDRLQISLIRLHEFN